MLKLFQKKKFQRVAVWTLLILFLPGISALVITTAFHRQEIEVFSCFPTTAKLDPFPGLNPLF